MSPDTRRAWFQCALAIGGFFGFFALMGAIDPNARPPRTAPAPVSAAGIPLGPDRLPNYTLEPDAAREHVGRLVERSRGEWDRLSASEQRWLDSMTAGRGRQMVYSRAKAMFPTLSLPEPPEIAARRQPAGGPAAGGGPAGSLSVGGVPD